MKSEEFDNICKYIEENKNNNKDHEVFINLSQFTKIKNLEDSELILEMLKTRFRISEYYINGIDHLDIYLKRDDLIKKNDNIMINKSNQLRQIKNESTRI